MGVSNSNVNTILNMDIFESGAFNAKQGMDYQYASAICKMLDLYDSDTNFYLVYERNEDFIIIKDDSVELCQVKNYKDKSYTVDNLAKPSDKSSDDKTSVIGKIITLYNSISSLLNMQVKGFLLINMTNKISINIIPENKKAYKYDPPRQKVCFSELTDDEKSNLESLLPSYKSIPYDDLTIEILLSYDKYQEDIRIKLENIINRKYLNPKYNLLSIYKTLKDELEQIFGKELFYSFDKLKKDINEMVTFKDSFKDYMSMYPLILSIPKFNNLNLKISNIYNTIRSIININSSYTKEYYIYNVVKNVYKTKYESTILNIEELYEKIINDNDVKSIDGINLLGEADIIAYILLIVGESHNE